MKSFPRSCGHPRRRWARPARVLLWVSMAGICVAQTTVYSSFTASGGYDTTITDSWCVSGPANATCGTSPATRYIAAPFVSPANYTLMSLTLAMINYNGTNGGVINLRSDASGSPGSVLASWTVGLPSSGTVTVLATTGVTLQAGVRYWVEAEAAASDTLNLWYINSQGLGGGVGEMNNGGWLGLSTGNGVTLPAFAVFGTPVSSGASLTITNSTLRFTMTAGGPLPANQNVSFTSGAGTIPWNIVNNESIFTLTPASGSVSVGSPETVSIGLNANALGLSAGTYPFALQVNYGSGFTQSTNISVTVVVTSPPSSQGSLGVSPSNLNFTSSAGSIPPPQNITITSSAGTLSWGATVALTSSAPATWLSVSPQSGSVSPSSPQATTVTIGTVVSTFPAGTYSATVTVTNTTVTIGSAGGSPRATGGAQSQTVTVALVVTPNQLAPAQGTVVFGALMNAPTPPAQTVRINTTTGGAIPFSTAITYQSPPSSSWLSVSPVISPTTANAPFTISIAVQITGLSPGIYIGYVNLTGPNNTSPPCTLVPTCAIAVTLVLEATPDATGSFTYQLGQPATVPAGIAEPLTGGDGMAALASVASDQGNWLAVTPTTGTPPLTLTMTANPGSLTVGQYQSILSVTDPGGDVFVVLVTLTISSGSTPTAQVISQVADGGGWSSTVILMNTGLTPANYSLNLWDDMGGAYAPQLATGAMSGIIPTGGSTLLRTADANQAPAGKTDGWAQETSSQTIGGTAIFRYDPTGQEAAVPLLTSGSTKLAIPYEVGAVLGVALANASTTQSATVTETIRNAAGGVLAQRTVTPNPLGPQSHTSFNPTGLVGLPGNGVVEYDSTAPIYALGIRAVGNALTSIEAISGQPAATKTIAQVADGGGWRTTIILVNTDSVTAAYNVNFWNDLGGVYSPALAAGSDPANGQIPVGGTVVIMTADANPAPSGKTEGWAQVLSSQSIGGTAIFRYDPTQQEAAVPFQTSGGTSLEVPFEAGSGLAIGVALANPGSTSATVTETIRDPNGNVISTRQLPTISAQGHTSFNPAPPSTPGLYTIEYDSNVSIYALGIRANGAAFTSERAIYK